ncbi:MAG: EAL domain-containing protein (putative c-di-GMP-specific phosphodiesterase class I), partial [Gammaproteobacteria bacterium]
YRYTVSIGVVSTAISANSAEAIIKMANATVISASNKQGENSYEICNEAHTVAAPPTKRPTTEIPATTTTKVDEELSITIEESKDNKPAAEVTPTAERSATLTVDVEKSDNIVEQSGQGEEHAADKPAPIPAPKPAPTTEAKAVPKPVPKPAPTPAPQGPAVKASPPAAEKPSKPHESDDAVLDDATLNIAALAVKRSFEEKRVVQTFQPVISFLAEEEENESELYATSLQLIDPDGLTVGAEEIMSRVKKVPSFPKYIDRWMLREAIGRAAHSSHDRYVFLMKISDASLADATLFNWLRELLSGLGKSHPGRAVALEISADTFSSRQKQAEALMTFLHKSHGFKFMLAHVKDVESMKTLTKKTNFDFLKVSPALIKQLSEEVSADAEEGGSLLTSLKKRGTAIVVQDVEDATTLTEVISIGADYAIGEFIGEASSQLDDLTNVESFEIS